MSLGKKSNLTFIIKLEILKYLTKSTKNEDEEPLSMGLIYVLDEIENLLGHIGWF